MQALQVAGLLREELCDLYAREKRCAHNRRVEEARLRAERRHEAMVATASAEVVTGGRGGNRYEGLQGRRLGSRRRVACRMV